MEIIIFLINNKVDNIINPLKQIGDIYLGFMVFLFPFEIGIVMKKFKNKFIANY